MIFISEAYKKYFISSTAYFLIMSLMRLPKNFEKIANLKIWQLISIWGSKTNFGKTPLKWCIFKREKKNIFYQYGSLVKVSFFQNDPWFLPENEQTNSLFLLNGVLHRETPSEY